MRTVSASLKEAMYAERTEELLLVLLTITHGELEDPLRLVLNTENITSRGEEYLAFLFDIQLPGEDAEAVPQAQIVFNNIDRRIVSILESTTEAPQLTIELIRWADPDTVEASWTGMTLGQVTYDVEKVSATLTYEDVSKEAFPVGTFSPGWFPGMF